MPESANANQIRKNTLYYTAGSLFYFFAQWLMTVIIVKTSGFLLAGLLSLAMNVTSAPAIAALFNIRSYQISDMNARFSDRTYIVSRFATCFLGLVLCLVISLINRYDSEKILAIMSYMLFRLVESFADVYLGIEQKKQRLDIAGLSLLIRGFGTIAAFYTVIRLTHNLIAANLAITAACVAVILLIDRRYVSGQMEEEKGQPAETVRKSFQLLWICLPLAVVSFLNNFSFAVPKIVLEGSHGQTILGIYNSISSPTIVIQLVASTIFAPWVPILSGFYNERNRADFNRTAFRIILIMLVLSVLCIGAVLILNATGILSTLLVFLYAEEIRAYTIWFLPVCVTAVLIAVNACLFGVCTLMRMMKSQLIIGAAGIAASYGFSYLLIPAGGVRGTIMALAAATGVQILVQIIIVGYGYRRKFMGGTLS